MHTGAMAVVRELGYRLGSQYCGECRRPGGSGLIGVLPTDLGNPCRTDVIARIEAEAEADSRGLRVVIARCRTGLPPSHFWRRNSTAPMFAIVTLKPP